MFIKGYEKRTYPARTSVCASKDTTIGYDFDNLRDEIYEPLAVYRQGANDQGLFYFNGNINYIDTITITWFCLILCK